jgi:hypothetical protein
MRNDTTIRVGGVALIGGAVAFLPLIWIPAGVAAFHALRPIREGSAVVNAPGSSPGRVLGFPARDSPPARLLEPS